MINLCGQIAQNVVVSSYQPNESMNSKQSKILQFALRHGFNQRPNSSPQQPQFELIISKHVKVRLHFWNGESTSLIYFDKVIQSDAQWVAKFDHETFPEVVIAAINSLL